MTLGPEERALFAKGVDDAAARSTGPALDVALAGLGWADALAEDEQLAVSALFEAQGRAGASSSALDVLLARCLGQEAALVLLPPFGQTGPPGRRTGGAVDVHGLVLAPGAGAGPAHVVCAGREEADGLAIATVPLDDLARRPVRGLDPDLGLVEVTGTSTGATTQPITAASWAGTSATGQRALAHELLGASAAMLELARAHALDRIQFGVPIASFQAVRHRLADTLVAIEAARAALEAAWAQPSTVNAAVAKALAGRGARVAARHCQQVLAGVGFTAEHALHRYVRRVRVLDGLLGDTRSLTRAMGEQLLADRALPTILPL